MEIIPSTNRYFFFLILLLGLCTIGLSHCDRHIDDQLYFKRKMHRIQKGKWKIEWIEIRFGTIAIALQWMKQYVWNFYYCWQWSTLCNAIKWINKNARVHWPPSNQNKYRRGWRLSLIVECQTHIHNKLHSFIWIFAWWYSEEKNSTTGLYHIICYESYSFYNIMIFILHTKFGLILLKRHFDINKQTR